MKKFIIWLVFLFYSTCLYGQEQYFGNTVQGASTSGVQSRWTNGWTGNIFNAPATGPITHLLAYVTNAVGSAEVMNLMVYNPDNTLNCYGTTTVSVPGSSTDWYGYAAAGLSGTCSVISGSRYTLFFTQGNVGLNIHYDSGVSGDAKSSATDYSGAPPATLPSGTDSSAHISIKCGVTPPTMSGNRCIGCGVFR